METVHLLPRLLHFSFQLFDLDQVTRIERQRRIVAVGFVRTETAIEGFLSSFFHCRRQPELLEVPIEIPEVSNRGQVFAGGNGTLIIDHTTASSYVTLHLGCLRFLGLRVQTVLLNMDPAFEEPLLAS